MNWFNIVSFVLNLLFVSGGLVMLVTIRATKRKTEAEALRAEVETDEKTSEVMREYIVKPLKSEINALRKDVRSLQKAINKISDCPHSNDCPVRRELQNSENNEQINAEK